MAELLGRVERLAITGGNQQPVASGGSQVNHWQIFSKKKQTNLVDSRGRGASGCRTSSRC